MPPVVPIPSPVPISISPGFGGGAPRPVVGIPAASSVASAPEVSSSEPDDPASTSTDQTTTSAATTSAATSTQPEDNSGDIVASTTSPDMASTTPDAPLPTDNFDLGFSGWNSYASGWTTSPWDANTADCYSGNCLSETDFNQQYENIKIGSPLDSGSFVIYFRNDWYNGAFGVGVCTTDTSSECESPSLVGGADSFIITILDNYQTDVWHYIYFTFQDGLRYKRYCGMIDDNNAADCVWQDTTTPNGTTYSGIMFFTANGLNLGASFYWDELVTAPHPPG
jgi:hypothetical protein